MAEESGSRDAKVTKPAAKDKGSARAVRKDRGPGTQAQTEESRKGRKRPSLKKARRPKTKPARAMSRETGSGRPA